MPEINLLILGGAGKSGRLVVREALVQGHKVTAYGRNTAKLEEEYSVAVGNQSLTVSSPRWIYYADNEVVLTCYSLSNATSMSSGTK